MEVMELLEKKKKAVPEALIVVNPKRTKSLHSNDCFPFQSFSIIPLFLEHLSIKVLFCFFERPNHLKTFS